MELIFNHERLCEAVRMDSEKVNAIVTNVVNSLIIAFISFFSTLAAHGYPPGPESWYTAVIAFCMAFFVQYATEREIEGHRPRK